MDHISPPSLTRRPLPRLQPVDWKLREGQIPFMKAPLVPGTDVAGVVEAAPAGSGFAPGDRVFADCGAKWGGYAEHVALPASQVAKLPEAIDFRAAAGVPLAFLTAWQALDAAGLSPGDHVLVHAGAGGVGGAAIQLAKARGLRVTTTASAKNAEHCAALGADAVIDYTAQQFDEACERPVHAILDTVGGADYVRRGVTLLGRGGTYVDFLAQARPAGILVNKLKSWVFLGPRYKVIWTRADGGQLAQVAALLAAGTVRPLPVQQVYPLEAAAEAQEAQKTHRVRGRLVLSVGEEK